MAMQTESYFKDNFILFHVVWMKQIWIPCFPWKDKMNYHLAVSYHYTYFVLTIFYIHKKKILNSRKFSTCDFRLIYMFWGILNSIWPFLKNVCLSLRMSPKFDRHCISRTNCQKLMKLYIQLYLHITWCILDFGAFGSRSFNVIRYFRFLKHSGIIQNCVQLYIKLLILSQSIWNRKKKF